MKVGVVLLQAAWLVGKCSIWPITKLGTFARALYPTDQGLLSSIYAHALR